MKWLKTFKETCYYCLKMSKYDKFDIKLMPGYTGYCSLTKYRTSINSVDESSRSTIYFPGLDDKSSSFTMEVDLGDGFKAK